MVSCRTICRVPGSRVLKSSASAVRRLKKSEMASMLSLVSGMSFSRKGRLRLCQRVWTVESGQV